MKSILPIFAFYYYAERGCYTKPVLRVWLLVFIVSAIYIYFMHTAEAEFAMIDFSSEQHVNGYAYIIVAVVPGIAIFKGNRIVQVGILLLTMVFALLSMKRGAIIVSILCLALYSLISLKKASIWGKIVLVILAIVVIRIFLDLFGFLTENNAFFSDRLDATLGGYSSGRDRIASFFLDYFFNKANAFEMLFGSGAYATIRIGDNFAHNDWIEILICEGLLGIILYANYWINAFMTIRKTRDNQEAYLAISLFVIIYFMKTFFSMSINDMSYTSTLFLGYYLSVAEKEKNP